MNMLFGSVVFVRNCMVTDNCCNKPTYFGYEVKKVNTFLSYELIIS